MIFTNSLIELQSVLEKSAKIEQEINIFYQSIKKAFEANKKLYICGNGGSASDAQHFAAEIVGRFERSRPGCPAIALNTDTSILTAISNDYGFQNIYSRQIQALGKEGDILLAISTSGNSQNIINAVNEANQIGLYTIALTGNSGGAIKNIVDLPIMVPSNRTCRIQEVHIFILHIICELLDNQNIK